jgi:hypothetical protein
MPHLKSDTLAPPTVEILDAPPATMVRPLALVDGRAYAAAWLYVRITRFETRNRKGEPVKLDPPLVETSRRLFVVRQDGVTFGPGADQPLDELGLEVALPQMPHPSRTWSPAGVSAYRDGHRPDPADVFNRVADVVSHFVDFDRSLASQRTMCELVACYVLATWVLDAFNVIGYLWPNGERGSGKTVLLHCVAEMAYLGHVILAGGSYASLRDLAEYGATLAFDDAENLADPRRTEADKRALLLAGNRRGSTVTVKELGPDNTWRTRHVNAFCPRLFSAIQLPDNVLASRAIVVPLIRTLDRSRASVDPLDHDVWPHDRRRLIDDLWALALAHLPEFRDCARAANQKARLTGRNLEPWHAILAVALWLDRHDPGAALRREAPLAGPGGEMESRETGLWDRMEDLSVRYQAERPDSGSSDFTFFVFQALYISIVVDFCDTVGVKVKAMMHDELPPEVEVPHSFEVTTQRVVDQARGFAHTIDVDPCRVTNRRVGCVLGRLRIQKAPRPGGRGSRRWLVTRDDLYRWATAYGLPLPPALSPQPPAPS